MNDDDIVWLDNVDLLQAQWLDVRHAAFSVVPNKFNKIPFNPLIAKALADGADYLVRVTDNTHFVTAGWITKDDRRVVLKKGRSDTN